MNRDTHSDSAPAKSRRIDIFCLVLGLLLIAAGGLLMADRLGYVEISDELTREVWRLWPLIFLFSGAASFVTARTRDERSSALWLTGLGVIFLTSTLELFGLGWGSSWPLWLVLAGLDGVFFAKPGRSRSSSFFLLILGVWLFSQRLALGSFSISITWPVALVIFGGYLTWRALETQREDARDEESDPVEESR